MMCYERLHRPQRKRSRATIYGRLIYRYCSWATHHSVALCVHCLPSCLLIFHYAPLLVGLPKNYRLATNLIPGFRTSWTVDKYLASQYDLCCSETRRVITVFIKVRRSALVWFSLLISQQYTLFPVTRYSHNSSEAHNSAGQEIPHLYETCKSCLWVY